MLLSALNDSAYNAVKSIHILLAIVAVDPWSGWPGVQALPMPLQMSPAPAVAAQETAAADTRSIATTIPSLSGVKIGSV